MKQPRVDPVDRMILTAERELVNAAHRLQARLRDVLAGADADIPVGHLAAGAGEVEAARARLDALRRVPRQ